MFWDRNSWTACSGTKNCLPTRTWRSFFDERSRRTRRTERPRHSATSFVSSMASFKEMKAKTGLNQQEFAETVGAPYRSYRGYESGEREVPTSILIKLHNLMNEEPLWILTGKQTPLGDTELDIVENALLAGLGTVPTALIEKSPEKAAAFLKLLEKLSLRQGEGLTRVDAQEIAQQSLKE